MVVWLYGFPFECYPNKRCVLVVFRFGKIGFSTGIHDATNTTTPILQECCLEEYIGNGWVLWEGVMRLFDGLSSQFLWQMTRILNLDTVIVYGYAHRTTCIVEISMAESVCQRFPQSFSRNLQFLFSRKANNLTTDGKMLEEECHACIQ